MEPVQDIRHEIKVILDEVRVNKAEEWMLLDTPCKAVYEPRKVNSVYFDDAKYSSLRDNLMGLGERKKLRLRWYSDLNGNGFINPKIEVKSRHGRVGSKVTVPLESDNPDILKKNYSELFDEVNRKLPDGHGLPLNNFFIPTLHVSYDRTYFESHTGIRMTFDRNIKFHDTHLPNGPLTSEAFNYNRIIMEIKFPPEQKSLIAKLLRKSNITPQRHSKYVAGLAVFGRAVYI
ncbi:MAG: polyphosphate polymerase domain-containing protein [Emcibacteraceae bacterium]|nr:polyphosphate polymerase domain-containing protein [Emcibacteraceae bacterium]